MSASDLKHVVKFGGFLFQCLAQFDERGDETAFDSFQGSQMNGGGDGVVAGLAAVDVVVGMDQFAAALPSEQFTGAIRNDLVGVHVGRGAGAGLENIEHKLPVPLAVDDFLGGLDDGGGQIGFEVA